MGFSFKKMTKCASSSNFLCIHDFSDLKTDVCGKRKLSPQIKFYKRHLNIQMSLISCHASPLLRHPLSVCITSLHVAFLLVDFHLPPHFLWDPSHLQTASVCGLLPWGKSALPETIRGLAESSAQSAEWWPRRGPAEGEWRAKCPVGTGGGLQWCSFVLIFPSMSV